MVNASEKTTQRGNWPAKVARRGVVGDIARGEGERRLFPMQRGELALELDMMAIGARDVTRAAGAGAARGYRLVHRHDDIGVLPHAEIIVGAPDGDLAAIGVVECLGESPGAALEIGEDAIAALGLQRVDSGLENA